MGIRLFLSDLERLLLHLLGGAHGGYSRVVGAGGGDEVDHLHDRLDVGQELVSARAVWVCNALEIACIVLDADHLYAARDVARAPGLDRLERGGEAGPTGLVR